MSPSGRRLGSFGPVCSLCERPVNVDTDSGLDDGVPVHVSCYVETLHTTITAPAKP